MDKKGFDYSLPLLLKVIAILALVFFVFTGISNAIISEPDSMIQSRFSLPIFFIYLVSGIGTSLLLLVISALLNAVFHILETEKNILERMEQKNEKEQIAASSVIHQPQSNIVMTEEGWVCPVCGWNNDPSDTICFNCNRK
ncbi:MAG: hypothetical protein KH202_13230 [Clostridiales bacterium]|nr:hypothetical protein [Clostridiales bacterium]